MKEPIRDDERLAALLDGRLDPREREELLAHLAASDDDYEVFRATAAFLREEEARGEVEREPELPEVARADVARRRRGNWRAWGALAAVLAGVSVVGVLISTEPELAGPVAIASSLRASAAGSLDAVPLPDEPKRGPSAVPPIVAENAAISGALLARLTVAVESRDSAVTAEAAARLEPLVPGVAVRRLAAHAGAEPAALRPSLREAADSAETIFGKTHGDMLRLGGWAETAALAARSQDAKFFDSRASRRALALAKKRAAENSDQLGELDDLQAAISRKPQPDWQRAANAADAYLALITQ